MRHKSQTCYEPPPERHFEETPYGRVVGVALLLWACLIGVFFYVVLG